VEVTEIISDQDVALMVRFGDRNPCVATWLQCLADDPDHREWVHGVVTNAIKADPEQSEVCRILASPEMALVVDAAGLLPEPTGTVTELLRDAGVDACRGDNLGAVIAGSAGLLLGVALLARARPRPNRRRGR
jgi:hypothetical protein